MILVILGVLVLLCISHYGSYMWGYTDAGREYQKVLDESYEAQKREAELSKIIEAHEKLRGSQNILIADFRTKLARAEDLLTKALEELA
jgi:cell division protein ZapA (FtsZ GTPase activity inhibitor)